MHDNSFIIEIMTPSGISRITYTSREAAETDFLAAEPKVGRRFANDPDSAKHTFRGHDGMAVVAMSEVHQIRVVDEKAFREGMSFRKSMELAEQADYERLRTSEPRQA